MTLNSCEDCGGAVASIDDNALRLASDIREFEGYSLAEVFPCLRVPEALLFVLFVSVMVFN